MTTSPTGSSGRLDPTRSPVDVSGWYAFAGCMLLVVGFLNVMHGYIAIQESDYLVNQIMFDNLETWGWVFVVFGALQILAGGMALAARSIGPIVGVTLSSIAIILWFAMIFAAPFPALVGIAINGAIIYGLTRVEV